VVKTGKNHRIYHTGFYQTNPEIFGQGISLPNFSSETLLSSSKSSSQAGVSGLSTDGSRGADDQRKNMSLDFDLRKTCAKFYLKILTLSASNLRAKNTQKGHFWACLIWIKNLPIIP
jgi:hypothetical protein